MRTTPLSEARRVAAWFHALSDLVRLAKASGLVRERRDGRWVYYALDPTTLEEVVAYIRLLKLEKHSDTCALSCCQ